MNRRVGDKYESIYTTNYTLFNHNCGKSSILIQLVTSCVRERRARLNGAILLVLPIDLLGVFSSAKSYQNWERKSSHECLKVVSVFWSFCRRCVLSSNFVCLYCLGVVFFHKDKITSTSDLSLVLNCVILSLFSKSQFTQNVSYDLIAFTRRNIVLPPYSLVSPLSF